MKYWLLILTLLTSLAWADEFDEFAEEESTDDSAFVINGFVEVEHGNRISDNDYHDDDDITGIRRLRLQTQKDFNKTNFYAKLDFVNDGLDETNAIDVRELKVNYKLSDTTDISLGRQVSTWGVADMMFINDLFPKNWVANFQGRDMEMLKDPSNSLRVTSYFGDTTVDLVYQPEFTSDLVPSGCKFTVFNPNSGGLMSNTDACGTIASSERDANLDNPEVAISIKQKIGLHEVALYGYQGYYKSPTSLEQSGAFFLPYYAELNVYGASYEGQVGPGILTSEFGYYDSKEDSDGDEYLIENSTMRYMIGYRQDITGNFSYGVQWYQEKMMDYDEYEKSFKAMNAAGYSYRHREYMNTYTLRLTYKAQQETLWFSLFTYIRPDDRDSFSKFEVSKKFTDNFKLTTGVNIFEGEDNYLDREFGMLKDDDNAFIRMNYSF